jgi:hypothetical protein
MGVQLLIVMGSLILAMSASARQEYSYEQWFQSNVACRHQLMVRKGCSDDSEFRGYDMQNSRAVTRVRVEASTNVKLFTVLSVIGAVLSSQAHAQRIALSCQESQGDKRLEIEIDNGNVKKNGLLERNVIALNANNYFISYFVDNVSSGGFLEKYVIDRQTGSLTWTFRRFDFFESGTALCKATDGFSAY